jgi:DNA-binding response OmpR family regulator
MIRRRILLVEDEPGLRRTLADLLIADGYTCRERRRRPCRPGTR